MIYLCTVRRDKKSKPTPLDSVHLTIRFPRVVRDFRVSIGNARASVITGETGCRFIGPPSMNETVNSKASFNIYENEFSFDAHSLNEIVTAEFLTDETTPDTLARSSRDLPITTTFPELI